MTFQRIVVSPEIDGRLRYLAGRTGLTANLLCRLGFCLSLGEPGIPDIALYGSSEEGIGREFNRYTLLGEYDLFFMALLRERMLVDGIDPGRELEVERQFKGHVSRGVVFLSQRVKALEDVTDLVAEAHQRMTAGLSAETPGLPGEGTAMSLLTARDEPGAEMEQL